MSFAPPDAKRLEKRQRPTITFAKDDRDGGGQLDGASNDTR
jgi:hypothetical protein